MGAGQSGLGGWRARLRRGLLAAIALLYAVSIPWYRDTGAEPGMILGLPDWVTVALGCYVGVALLNALAWLLTEVPEGELTRGLDGEPGGERPESR